MNIKNVIVICFLMSAKICITSATSISNELVLIPQAYELCEKIEELVHKHQLPELQSRVRILKNKFDDYHKTVLPVLKAALDCSKTNDEALILLRNPRAILSIHLVRDLHTIADDIQKAGRVPFSIADIVKEQRQLMGS